MKKNKKIAFCVAIFCVFAVIAGIIPFAINSDYTAMATAEVYAKTESNINILAFEELSESPSTDTKNVGIIESIFGETDNLGYAVHYPYIDNEYIDEDIIKNVDGFIESFNEKFKEYNSFDEGGKAYLNVDYESYRPYSNMVSIVFHVSMHTADGSVKHEKSETLFYNTETGIPLKVYDVFGNGYLKTLSANVRNYFRYNDYYSDKIANEKFNNGTSPRSKNFERFTISSQNVVFYIDKSELFNNMTGDIALIAPLKSFADYLRYDSNGNLVIPDTDMDTIDNLIPESIDIAEIDETNKEENNDLTEDISNTDLENTENESNEGIPKEDIPVNQIENENENSIENNNTIDGNNDADYTDEANNNETDTTNEIDPSKPMIAITYDDGPHKTVTDRILDVFEQYQCKATFFVLGNRVDSYSEPLKRAFDMGCEIGNHSYNHKNLAGIGEESLSSQINDTNSNVEAILGQAPKLLRPPYGSIDGNLQKNADMPLILWSIDTLDWKTRNTDKIVNEILSKVKDGDIILMHDLYDTTAAATEIVVPKLIEMGYQLVTVSELAQYKGVEFSYGSKYGRITGN